MNRLKTRLYLSIASLKNYPSQNSANHSWFATNLCPEGITADFWQVVPSKSATLEQYPYVTIHADHIGMTKFKVKNNDYKRIAVQLKRWMKELALPETMLGKAPGYDATLV